MSPFEFLWCTPLGGGEALDRELGDWRESTHHLQPTTRLPAAASAPPLELPGRPLLPGAINLFTCVSFDLLVVWSRALSSLWACSLCMSSTLKKSEWRDEAGASTSLIRSGPFFLLSQPVCGKQTKWEALLTSSPSPPPHCFPIPSNLEWVGESLSWCFRKVSCNNYHNWYFNNNPLISTQPWKNTWWLCNSCRYLHAENTPCAREGEKQTAIWRLLRRRVDVHVDPRHL